MLANPINEGAAGEPQEVGRARAIAPGCLKREDDECALHSLEIDTGSGHVDDRAAAIFGLPHTHPCLSLARCR